MIVGIVLAVVVGTSMAMERLEVYPRQEVCHGEELGMEMEWSGGSR